MLHYVKEIHFRRVYLKRVHGRDGVTLPSQLKQWTNKYSRVYSLMPISIHFSYYVYGKNSSSHNSKTIPFLLTVVIKINIYSYFFINNFHLCYNLQFLKIIKVVVHYQGLKKKDFSH